MAKKEQLERQLKRTLAMYRQVGVYIELGEDGIVRAEQREVVNGLLMTQKHLLERTKALYPEQHVHPHVYTFDGDMVTPEWIADQMERYGVKRKDLIKNLGIDSSTMSLYLNGKRSMTKSTKALFFYYFMVMEVNDLYREMAMDKGE